MHHTDPRSLLPFLPTLSYPSWCRLHKQDFSNTLMADLAGNSWSAPAYMAMLVGMLVALPEGTKWEAGPTAEYESGAAKLSALSAILGV